MIIPARDVASTLSRALDAVLAQELEWPFEVIVVDDGSVDDTAEIAARYEPRVTVVRNPRSRGPGAARNCGARLARAPILAFTDADCFAAPQWLARGLEAIADADLLQGSVRPDSTVARTPFDRTLVVEGDGGFYQTANLLVRRELFEAVGGFTDWSLERWGESRFSADRRRGRSGRTPIGEDTLFAWTARRRGARSAFAPRAIVEHAVVPGGIGDELADRWHWSRDMPGLASRVPELRSSTFYRRWFFHRKTARFDAGLAGAMLAAATHRKAWLVAALPYVDWVAREGARWGLRRAVPFALGSVAVDAVTLAGLLTGSIAWRCVVL